LKVIGISNQSKFIQKVIDMNEHWHCIYF